MSSSFSTGWMMMMLVLVYILKTLQYCKYNLFHKVHRNICILPNIFYETNFRVCRSQNYEFVSDSLLSSSNFRRQMNWLLALSLQSKEIVDLSQLIGIFDINWKIKQTVIIFLYLVC